MKITKRQLRKIINEEKSKLQENRRNVDGYFVEEGLSVYKIQLTIAIPPADLRSVYSSIKAALGYGDDDDEGILDYEVIAKDGRRQ